jgi:hemerythrin
MDLIHWDDKYLVGVEEIDRQHKEFMKLINRLQIVQKGGKGEPMAKRLLLELVKYADYHFVSEENLMLIIHYPEHEEQHREHDKLMKELDRRIVHYGRKAETLEELLEYLHRWFATHTTEEDRKIGEFVRSSVNVNEKNKEAAGG